MPDRPYPSDEVIRRGQALYDSRIRADVEPDHAGEFLVLNIETGAYETDPDEMAAYNRAKARNAEGPFYILRIGYPVAFRIGHNASPASQ